MLRVIIYLLTASFLSSCASHLNLQQCMSMDWHKEGFKDGMIGKRQRNLSSAIEDCAQFNVTVDTNRYQAGWDLGMQQFCQPDETLGYAEGFAGKPLSHINGRENICREAAQTLSLAQYKKGYSQGLNAFCTFENGRNVARQGEKMPKVCVGAAALAFERGFNTGREQFCRNHHYAFALGKAGKSFPDICDLESYANFKNEYERGFTVHKRVATLEARLAGLQNTIERDARLASFRLASDGHYQLGSDESDSAKNLLAELRIRQNEASQLEREVFQLKTMR